MSVNAVVRWPTWQGENISIPTRFAPAVSDSGGCRRPEVPFSFTACAIYRVTTYVSRQVQLQSLRETLERLSGILVLFMACKQP